ncbi:MAG: hypothetical protein WD939_00790 [Dehalococcoidia bacterium]
MKLLVAAALLLAFVIATSVATRSAKAKGSALGVEPDSGELGTQVELWSTDWEPNVEVRLYAAFATSIESSYPARSGLIGPFATVTSDVEGVWRTEVEIGSLAALERRDQPGYVVFRAESDGSPDELNEASTHFVLEHQGRRPAGSGEIRLSISLASGASVPAAVFGWRKAGEPWFFSPYSVIPIPFDVTIPSLSDGDWEIVALTGAGSEPIGDATYDLGTAALCFNPSCASDTPQVEVHRARRVTISDAEVVDVDLQLGNEGESGVQPPPVPTEGDEAWDTAGLIAGATLLLALLTIASYFAGRRRL